MNTGTTPHHFGISTRKENFHQTGLNQMEWGVGLTSSIYSCEHIVIYESRTAGKVYLVVMFFFFVCFLYKYFSCHGIHSIHCVAFSCVS